MKLTKRREKLLLAALFAILVTVLAVAEVIDGNAAMTALIGLASGVGLADGVNIRQQ